MTKFTLLGLAAIQRRLPRLLTAETLERNSHPRNLTMKIMHVMAALLLISSLATPATAQERTNKSSSRAQTHVSGGREVAAPPWSAACMTDHGPSECGEPMWVYGSRAATARYGNPF
jgi:hypothetical protein